MTGPMFLSLDSAAIAKCIGGAQHSVCYAAPGIQQAPAEAMATREAALSIECVRFAYSDASARVFQP